MRGLPSAHRENVAQNESLQEHRGHHPRHGRLKPWKSRAKRDIFLFPPPHASPKGLGLIRRAQTRRPPSSRPQEEVSQGTCSHLGGGMVATCNTGTPSIFLDKGDEPSPRMGVQAGFIRYCAKKEGRPERTPHRTQTHVLASLSRKGGKRLSRLGAFSTPADHNRHKGQNTSDPNPAFRLI